MKTRLQNKAQQWAQYIKENVRGEITRTSLIKYAEYLLYKNLPIIFENEHLSKLLGIEYNVLVKIINSPQSFYYSFDIPKRSGGKRKIDSPYPLLSEAQDWIYNNILLKEIVHASAFGFVKGRSIVDNARIHLGSPFLLKLDIKDFFPSIKNRRVIALFKFMGYPQNVAYYLASLCCLYNRLPQGSSTSPMISNLVSKKLDRRLSALAKSLNLKYTRYADDMAFSGEKITVKMIEYIMSIVSNEGFLINNNKTQLIKGNRRKILTGISISGSDLRLPKATKRKIRSEIYYISKYGLAKHLKKINSNDLMLIERLIGKLVFWKNIEPDNEYVVSSLRKLIEIQKAENLHDYDWYKN